MVMKKDRRKRDIKSKLVAAICMLMVSCIMVVSSTYAWFTLSTAPEVTGITTTIGANGNLEMALLPKADANSNAYATAAAAMAAIGNATGSLSTVEANTTWGNLVNLSDTSYGLSELTLNPSKLAVANNQIPSNYLSSPKYGADGRFTSLNATGFAKTYNGTVFADGGYGVRGVGTSSGMSALETAYRTALSDGNTAMQSAITAAKNAVSVGGSKLASMAVGKSTGTETFTGTDKQALVDAYDAILTAISHIETALKNYIIADILTESGLDDTTYATVLTQLNNATLAQLAERTGVNAALVKYVETLETLKTTVSTNRNNLNGLAADSTSEETTESEDGTTSTITVSYYKWTTLSPYVTALADIDAMLLNGKTMDYWMEKKDGTFTHLGELVGQMSNLVLEVNVGDAKDDGIYAQLADFVDDFSAPATISGIEYQGISADNLQVTMKIYATAEPAYLPASKTVATTFTATQSPFGDSAGSNLTDFYGYIIDMAFRTNAADSNLQLQTDAVDRVYADQDDNQYTMGHGSSMTFTVGANANYSVEQMVTVMSYIRVVFFNPDAESTGGYAIYGYARLDATEGNYEVTYVDADGKDESKGYTVTMKLKMWDVTLNADEDGNNPAGGWATSNTIVAMPQNEAKAVSTLVYLDGENLTNADVGNAAFDGTMNLQFSSSADLKPMEYGDLRNEENLSNDVMYNVMVNGSKVTTVAKGAEFNYTLPTTANGNTIDYSAYTITVTMNGTDITSTALSSADGEYKVSIAEVTGTVVITATPNSTSGG